MLQPIHLFCRKKILSLVTDINIDRPAGALNLFLQLIMDVKSEIIFSKIGECCVYKNKKKLLIIFFHLQYFPHGWKKIKKRKINNQMVYKNGSIFL